MSYRTPVDGSELPKQKDPRLPNITFLDPPIAKSDFRYQELRNVLTNKEAVRVEKKDRDKLFLLHEACQVVQSLLHHRPDIKLRC
jgi:hypothetical protein